MNTSATITISIVLLASFATAETPQAAPSSAPASQTASQPASAPPLAEWHPAVPDGLGVCVHFTSPKPGEMEMLAASGVRFIRMDFWWGDVEQQKGRYDFGRYDRLMAALRPHGIRAILILDYGNALYDNNLPPTSPEARAAFAAFASAAAQHFGDSGVIWEMWNEPNIKQFWKPQPDAAAYSALVLETGKAMRLAAPRELFVGPATSEIDFKFLEACFQAGLLEYWSGVTVHPYRPKAPETAGDDYRKLRQLIDRYAPKGKHIPVISGEWGYPSTWPGFDADKQGKYLPRTWLANMANDVPLSIWYDWHDDGPSPTEYEHHFGMVLHEYKQGRQPVYEPKPAYLAARTLTAALAGLHFEKRLDLPAASATTKPQAAATAPASAATTKDAKQEVPDDYVLSFTDGRRTCIVAWTTATTPHEVTIPGLARQYDAIDHLGRKIPTLTAGKDGLTVTLTDGPQYLSPRP